MIHIRPYRPQDSIQAGILLADCLAQFDLEDFEPHERVVNLGPFYNARSLDPAHQQQIAILIQAPVVLVAQEERGQLKGILRATHERVLTLCVHDWYFFQDIGRQLLENYEQESLAQGVKQIKVAAPMFAVSFYLRLGYKRSTGIRSTPAFPAGSLPRQPMKKTISRLQFVLPITP